MARPRVLQEWIDGTTICRESSTIGFVWSFYECCLQFFTKLVPLVPEAVPNAPAKAILNEEVGRLFSWGDGFENGELDRTLGRDPELKNATLEYLAGLGTALADKIFDTPILNRVDGDVELESKASQLRSMLNNAKIIIEDSGEDDSDLEPDIDVRSKDTKHMLDDIASDIKFYNLRLMDLLPSIERTALQKEDIQYPEKATIPTASVQFQVSEPAHAYVLQVRDKFPEADRKLVQRLGEANWQRHIRIREDPHNSVQSTVADVSKSVFIPVSLFDSGLGTSIAPTTLSHSSFRTSATEGQAWSYRVPPTPREVSTGDHFTCEICGHVLKNIKNRVDWKIHVFADLKPYLCTFASCPDELCAFPTRALWTDHEFRKHRIEKLWRCYLCSDELSSPSILESHISKVHSSVLNSEERKRVLNMAECFTEMSIEPQECPMCMKRGMKTRKEFITHVAKHMESIALAALPREADSDSGSDHEVGGFNESESEAVSFKSLGPGSQSEPRSSKLPTDPTIPEDVDPRLPLFEDTNYTNFIPPVQPNESPEASTEGYPRNKKQPLPPIFAENTNDNIAPRTTSSTLTGRESRQEKMGSFTKLKNGFARLNNESVSGMDPQLCDTWMEEIIWQGGGSGQTVDNHVDNLPESHPGMPITHTENGGRSLRPKSVETLQQLQGGILASKEMHRSRRHGFTPEKRETHQCTVGLVCKACLNANVPCVRLPRDAQIPKEKPPSQFDQFHRSFGQTETASSMNDLSGRADMASAGKRLTTTGSQSMAESGSMPPKAVGCIAVPIDKFPVRRTPSAGSTPSTPPDDVRIFPKAMSESEFDDPTLRPSQGDAVLIRLLGGGKALEAARTRHSDFNFEQDMESGSRNDLGDSDSPSHSHHSSHTDASHKEERTASDASLKANREIPHAEGEEADARQKLTPPPRTEPPFDPGWEY